MFMVSGPVSVPKSNDQTLVFILVGYPASGWARLASHFLGPAILLLEGFEVSEGRDEGGIYIVYASPLWAKNALSKRCCCKEREKGAQGHEGGGEEAETEGRRGRQLTSLYVDLG